MGCGGSHAYEAFVSGMLPKDAGVLYFIPGEGKIQDFSRKLYMKPEEIKANAAEYYKDFDKEKFKEILKKQPKTVLVIDVNSKEGFKFMTTVYKDLDLKAENLYFILIVTTHDTQTNYNGNSQEGYKLWTIMNMIKDEKIKKTFVDRGSFYKEEAVLRIQLAGDVLKRDEKVGYYPAGAGTQKSLKKWHTDIKEQLYAKKIFLPMFLTGEGVPEDQLEAGLKTTDALLNEATKCEKYPELKKQELPSKFPKMKTPKVSTPKVDLPDAPKVDLPDAPNIDLPDVDLPNVDLPNVDLPNVDLPNVDLPNVDLPNVDMPNVDMPNMPKLPKYKKPQKLKNKKNDKKSPEIQDYVSNSIKTTKKVIPLGDKALELLLTSEQKKQIIKYDQLKPTKETKNEEFMFLIDSGCDLPQEFVDGKFYNEQLTITYIAVVIISGENVEKVQKALAMMIEKVDQIIFIQEGIDSSVNVVDSLLTMKCSWYDIVEQINVFPRLKCLVPFFEKDCSMKIKPHKLSDKDSMISMITLSDYDTFYGGAQVLKGRFQNETTRIESEEKGTYLVNHFPAILETLQYIAIKDGGSQEAIKNLIGDYKQFLESFQ